MSRTTNPTELDSARSILEPSSQLYISAAEVLRDYSLAVKSREASLVGRREVLSGKAKFGIFGDGKEVAQIAMAKAFRKGDIRSGYYRDQTFMFATGMSDIQQFFAQLYADTDVNAEPHSAGRQMNSHYATRSLAPDGSWRAMTEMFNSSADLSPVAAQMPRIVGLAYASRLYRELEALEGMAEFSRNGDEIVFGTIGNAACAEGLFWESVNAIGVQGGAVVLSIWDDGYGISVSNEFQLTKESISELLKGFERSSPSGRGFDIYTVKAWDYPALVETYMKATQAARSGHIPAIIHVVEATQPQGHSTSGSQERYKSAERLAWEAEFDAIKKMRQWIVEQRIATAGELDQIERNGKKLVENIRVKAWKAFTLPVYKERSEAAKLIQALESQATDSATLSQIRSELLEKQTPFRRDIMPAVHQALVAVRHDGPSLAKDQLLAWIGEKRISNMDRFGSHLHSQSVNSALKAPITKAVYSADSPILNGYQILTACFDAMLSRDPRVFAFGEDVGLLGGVNQAFAGLQAKHGEYRVADTGIREATIVGQAIGMAMRGLRPIAEIQYLDYLLYALQLLSDDLATLHWRTKGGQKAPVIIRTRGHRLEGIWHAGSPMAGTVHLLRGMYVLVPRNMTQAAGFYNTLLLSDEPGLIVEVLNGYRLKETLPDNIGEFTVPLGVPEIVREGSDVSVVTYGAMVRLGMEASERLRAVGIDVELIDVQSLLPFDIHGRIQESLKKTSRIVFVDEDVPGGTTAYMMQEVLERQSGFQWLDSDPRTLTAREHRAAYGSDGIYFSKPNVEDIFDAVYDMMSEAEPGRFPELYRS